MKLGDIYKSKTSRNIIQIDSFATDINKEKEMVIIYSNIMQNGPQIGSIPSFNGYGSQEDIESKYEILVPQEDLRNYDSFEDIFSKFNLLEEEDDNNK